MNAPALTLPEMTALLATLPALLFGAVRTADKAEGEERREPTEAELREYKPGGSHSHGCDIF